MNPRTTLRSSSLGIVLCVGACAGPGEPELGLSSQPIGVPATAITVNTSANAIGRISEHGNGLYRSFHQYDALGRAVAVQHVIDNTSYVYGTAYGYPAGTVAGPGSVTKSTTFPDGETVAYTYDSGGQQQSIKTTPSGGAQQTIVTRVLRNVRGETTQVDFGNGTQQFHVYNDGTNLRLNRIYTSFSGTIQQYTYTFDAVGNVTAVTDLNGDSTAIYSYDSLDRLTGGTWAYGYDTAGNLTTKEGVAQTYGGTGRGPHALATSAGLTYTYDANGNLISRSDGLALTWNAENMPIETIGGTSVSGAYTNALLTTRRHYLGEVLLKKVQGGSTTLYLPSMRIEDGVPIKYFGSYAERSKDGSLKFYHGDHLGSSTLITDASGAVIRRASYKPYGEERTTSVSTFSAASGLRLEFNFKEKEQDYSGFYDYGARLFNPATGRFLSADTDLSDGLNRYAYVLNNPLRFVDPTGHAAEPLDRNGDGFVAIYLAGIYNPKQPTMDKVLAANVAAAGRALGHPIDRVIYNNNNAGDAYIEHANSQQVRELRDVIGGAKAQHKKVEIAPHSNGVWSLAVVAPSLAKNSIAKVVLLQPAIGGRVHGRDGYTVLSSIARITPDKTMISSTVDPMVSLMSNPAYRPLQFGVADSLGYKTHDSMLMSHKVAPGVDSYFWQQNWLKTRAETRARSGVR